MTDPIQHHCSVPWYMRPPVWVLGLVLVALAVFGVVEMIGRPAAIPYGTFLDQLDAGNVASVTFQGTQIDGLFKHPIGETASNGAAQQNIFRSRVPDFGDPALLPELRKEHVAIDVVTSSNWVSWLGRLPWPMVVFLAFVLIAGFVRLVRGGKAQSGSTMPMHPMQGPMQGMFGLVSGLFGKQQAEGPPQHGGDEAKSG
jgi:ATP-dependent Zn protease